jgi:hypothetical protein
VNLQRVYLRPRPVPSVTLDKRDNDMRVLHAQQASETKEFKNV